MTEQPTTQTVQQPATQPVQQAHSSYRQLLRSDPKMVAGVCQGIAQHLGVDVTLVRLAFVLGTIFGFGSFLVAYVVMWVVVPRG